MSTLYPDLSFTNYPNSLDNIALSLKSNFNLGYFNSLRLHTKNTLSLFCGTPKSAQFIK